MGKSLNPSMCLIVTKANALPTPSENQSWLFPENEVAARLANSWIRGDIIYLWFFLLLCDMSRIFFPRHNPFVNRMSLCLTVLHRIHVYEEWMLIFSITYLPFHFNHHPFLYPKIKVDILTCFYPWIFFSVFSFLFTIKIILNVHVHLTSIWQWST